VARRTDRQAPPGDRAPAPVGQPFSSTRGGGRAACR
jgi:hypothetical protein